MKASTTDMWTSTGHQFLLLLLLAADCFLLDLHRTSEYHKHKHTIIKNIIQLYCLDSHKTNFLKKSFLHRTNSHVQIKSNEINSWFKGKRWSICIAPRRENLTSKALRCGSHSLTCQHTTPAFTRSSPGGAMTEWTVTAPADEAYYSLIDPVRMKGWVGLVGWPTADVWPTKWSYVQLAVRRRTGKVCRSKTCVLPLCYAANCATSASALNNEL